MATKLDQWFAERETLLAEVIEGLEPIIKKCFVFHNKKEQLLFSKVSETQNEAQRQYDFECLLMQSQSIYSIGEALRSVRKLCMETQATLASRRETLTSMQEPLEPEVA